MYSLRVDEQESVLELTVHENISEDDLRVMLKDLKFSRKQFEKDYKFLVILPSDLREGNIDEREKIDLSAYTAKLKGLRQVVLQTPEKGSPHVERLKKIYQELAIRVSVSHCHIESQKQLGIFWK